MACEVLEPISPLTVKDIEQAFQDIQHQSMETIFRQYVYLPLKCNLLSLRRNENGVKTKLNLASHALIEGGPPLTNFFTPEAFAVFCVTRLRELFPDSHSTCSVETRRTGFLWAKEPWVIATLQIRNV